MAVLREHMRENGFSRFAIKQYTINGRHFLRHISGRGTRIDRVQPDDVAAYLRVRRGEYQRRKGHLPEDDTDWRSRYTASIHMLLRLAQGVWPPPTALESRVQSFKQTLQKERLSPGTVRQYLEQARLFLTYLELQELQIEHVKPKHVDSFIAECLRIYRKKHGRPPGRLIHWRAEHTKGVHRLLRDAQKQWPPPSSADLDLQRFEEHLIGRGWRPKFARYYRNRAKQFAEYLDERGLSLSTIAAADVTAYLRAGFREYRRHRSNPPNARHWQIMNQRAVHSLLRFVHGEWPPGSGPPQALADFRGYLEEHRYSPVVIPSCISAVRQFLLHLKGRGVSVQATRPADVEDFLDTKRERYERRYRRLPRNPQQWRTGYTGPIHRLLRMIDPHWPPPEPPRDDQERFRREILDGYGRGWSMSGVFPRAPSARTATQPACFWNGWTLGRAATPFASLASATSTGT